MRWSAWTIAKREIKSIFVSPVAYVVIGIFSLLCGLQFLMSLERFDQQLQQAKVQAQLMKNPEILNELNLNSMLISNVVGFSFFILLFAIPAIGMRLLTEEKTQKTYELLLTSPLSTWDIVLGKFMAGLTFVVLMIATHALFLGVMFGYGNPEPGPVFSGYLGMVLAGATFVAIGLFASSLTSSQIVAFFTALFVSLVLLMVSWAASTTSGNMATFLERASVTTHFESFNQGVISVSSLIYFITLWAFFLTGTKIAVESVTRS